MKLIPFMALILLFVAGCGYGGGSTDGGNDGKTLDAADGFVWGVRFHSLESRVAASIEIYVRKQLTTMIRTQKTSANLSATRAKLQAAAIKEKKAKQKPARKKPSKSRSEDKTSDQKDGLLASLYKKALKRM